MSDKIQLLVNEKKDRMLDFTQKLITIPSPSGKENAVRNCVNDMIEFIGFDDISTDAMGNIYGRLGKGKQSIAFDCHMDTVDVGNPDQWNHDPFSGMIDDGIIFGRGASDQKGGLASALHAIDIIKEIGLPRGLQIIFVGSVREEEHEGLNWQYLIDVEGIKPDYVVLTEPTNLEIAIGQKGRVDFKIETEGTSAHGANPDLGTNAIYKMLSIIEDIKDLQENMPVDPLFGKSQISVTDIRSSSPNINATPDKAVIHVDRRLGPNESDATAIAQLKRLSSVKTAHAQIYIPEYTKQISNDKSFSFKSYYPSWTMNQEHLLVQHAMKAYRTQFHQEPPLKYWPFSTNGAATKGIYNIPTIGFGPGKEEHAHTPEDQVAIEQLVQAIFLKSIQDLLFFL
ncbi:MAG: YgeY family selenium metabolism-linked hydrolase [Candidatus Hodarchaeales archaeon]|jgi:putative selenium metabolism hydrolase